MRQMSLFDNREVYNPLTSRLRPDGLNGFVEREHLLGEGELLRQLIEQDKTPSMISWGPPGVGKTILVGIITEWTDAQFIDFSAAASGIKEIKEVIAQAKNSRRMGVKTPLSMDEIHRSNETQRDTFLPYIERKSIILIRATTENPPFKINSALLSRYRVFVPRALTENDLARLIKNALKSPRGLGYLNVKITNYMTEITARFIDEGAGTTLNTLEITVTNGITGPNRATVTEDVLKQCIRKESLLYDKKGEERYNLISALRKSMRNPDPDAAVYWLTRMSGAGEDPLYVTYRLIRFASEDIGMADNQALTLAVPAYQARHSLGMSERSVHLSHTVIYPSVVSKSNSAHMACESAKVDVQDMLTEPVPLTIRNAPTELMKDLHYGDDYVYAHDTKEKITRMQCLPNSLEGREYCRPTSQGAEEPIKGRLEGIRRWKRGK